MIEKHTIIITDFQVTFENGATRRIDGVVRELVHNGTVEAGNVLYKGRVILELEKVPKHGN